MIVRIRSPNGTSRLEVTPTTELKDLRKELYSKLNLSPGTEVILSNLPEGRNPFTSEADTNTLKQLGIQHGDILFAKILSVTAAAAESKTLINTNTATETLKTDVSKEKDILDEQLEKLDGRILRKRDPKFCKHAINGMCDYCAPLEPYHETSQKNLKHLSFHAFLRKNRSDAAKLQMPSFVPSPNCKTGHLPYPQAICSKCQPSAITLQRQAFRFVDHLEFATADVVDSFLQNWRKSGAQIFGLLLGTYQLHHPQVPLGIKAVVEAIYLPKQMGAQDWVEVVGINQEKDDTIPNDILDICQKLGLQVVGMIWTDLEDDGTKQGKVQPKRHAESWFLSAQEAIFAAKMQSFHPRVDGYGSRFVTCVLTGNALGEVEAQAYQVSLEAQAMVEADLVDASVRPDLLRIKESIKTRYVPEVFYSLINEYGLKSSQAAKPCFPVDYWLVNVSNGFPSSPTPLFTRHTSVESFDGISPLAKLKDIFDSGIEDVTDFGFVVLIHRTNILSEAEFQLLCRVAATKGQQQDWEVLSQSDGWQTLMAVISTTVTPSTAPPLEQQQQQQQQQQKWACEHCTYENSTENSDCEICGLPR